MPDQNVSVLEKNTAEVIIPEKNEEQITNDYKKLNDKCDKVITKIRNRKDKKQQSS